MIIDTISPNQNVGTSSFVEVYLYNETLTCNIREIAFSLNSDAVTLRLEHGDGFFEVHLRLPNAVGLDNDVDASIVEVQTKKWHLKPNVEADDNRPFRLLLKSDSGTKKLIFGMVVRQSK